MEVIATRQAGRARPPDSLALRHRVARSDVEIDPAARSRRKRVWVTGDPEQIGMQLRVLAGEE